MVDAAADQITSVILVTDPENCAHAATIPFAIIFDVVAENSDAALMLFPACRLTAPLNGDDEPASDFPPRLDSAPAIVAITARNGAAVDFRMAPENCDAAAMPFEMLLDVAPANNELLLATDFPACFVALAVIVAIEAANEIARPLSNVALMDDDALKRVAVDFTMDPENCCAVPVSDLPIDLAAVPEKELLAVQAFPICRTVLPAICAQDAAKDFPPRFESVPDMARKTAIRPFPPVFSRATENGMALARKLLAICRVRAPPITIIPEMDFPIFLDWLAAIVGSEPRSTTAEDRDNAPAIASAVAETLMAVVLTSTAENSEALAMLLETDLEIAAAIVPIEACALLPAVRTVEPAIVAAVAINRTEDDLSRAPENDEAPAIAFDTERVTVAEKREPAAMDFPPWRFTVPDMSESDAVMDFPAVFARMAPISDDAALHARRQDLDRPAALYRLPTITFADIRDIAPAITGIDAASALPGRLSSVADIAGRLAEKLTVFWVPEATSKSLSYRPFLPRSASYWAVTSRSLSKRPGAAKVVPQAYSVGMWSCQFCMKCLINKTFLAANVRPTREKIPIFPSWASRSPKACRK